MSFNNLFEDAKCSICIKDARGIILYSNKFYRTQFAKGEQICGKTCKDFLSEKLWEQSVVTDRKVIRRGQPVTFVLSVESSESNEAEKWFHVVKLPLTDERKACTGLIAFITEVNVQGRFKAHRKSQLNTSPGFPLNVQELVNLYFRATDHELLLMQLISSGYLNKQIAKIFGVSVRTIENRRQQLLEKLELSTTPELIRLAVQLECLGLLPGLEEHEL